jgi:hypothetical protein
MADNGATAVTDVNSVAGRVLDALVEVLKSSTTPDALQAQQLLLRRLALEGDVVPSRIPAPKNITEIGGYINLLQALNMPELRAQMLAAILGVAGPAPAPGLTPQGLPLFDVLRANDRPAGAQQATFQTQFSIRNDFASAFDQALKTIHEAGCVLPLFSPLPGLPPAAPTPPAPTDLLRFLGRTLDLAPSAALIDPDADALAVARPQGSGPADLEVVARQVDAAAPQAGSVTAQPWIAWQCDANQCTETTANRTYLRLTPILNSAGWYQPKPTPPSKLSAPGTWARWTNITGLIAGITTYGDELRLRHTSSEIAASSLRDLLDWVWNGTAFVAPV